MRAEGGAQLVSLSWPLIVLRVPAAVDAAVLHEVFAAFEAVFDRRAKFASLIDLSDAVKLPGAAERRQVAEWMERVAARQKLYNVGSAHVVGSAAVRGGLTAINWIFRPPTPQGYFPDVVSAFDWCAAQLEAASVPMPEDTLRLRASLALGRARAGSR